jgi:zinc protease
LRTRQLIYAGLVGAATLATPLRSVPAAPRTAGKNPVVNFTQYRLPNGLRVVLAPDRSAPVVAVSVTYDVGSRNEREGRTGFAHLFEHMMFQGSQNVGKGEHFVLVNDNGGSFNGTTNEDRTNYFETVPANQLDLALFLEADRMRALDISQANLDNQRAVVQEERRQSYDNRPYGRTFEEITALAYKSFAYRHSTIGSMADLNAATLDDVRAFFRTYYAPNNAVLAVAGDFKPAETKAKIAKYFGSIPRQPAPPPVDISEPPPSGEQRKRLEDPLARLARFDAAYKTVSGDEPDYFALNLLASVLSRGRTGRLYSALVEKNLALSASASEDESRGPGLFHISASLPPAGDVDAVEKAIDAEIERLQSQGPSADEINKAVARARVASISRLATALGKANALSQNAVFYNDPGRINTFLSRLQAVTASDVQRAAQKYLKRENRVVVITEPAGDDGGFGGFVP